jgi:hypothetical protein
MLRVAEHEWNSATPTVAKRVPLEALLAVGLMVDQCALVRLA